MFLSMLIKSKIRSKLKLGTSKTSSLIEPMYAKWCATWLLSNAGHNVPGVSKTSIPLAIFTHCFPRVTPALLPVCVFALPHKLLIKVLFPLLGTPKTITRKMNFTPFCFSFSIFACNAWTTAFPTFFAVPLSVEFSIMQPLPNFAKYSCHFFVISKFAMSHLFKT